ncbi:MAG: acetylornithine transaminase [Ignavibacteria bacterium]|jgi:predicted acetylornithine/succinylornithine family transaminase|nr:acetylornithine transaminase [Ignavibacteria bacterium]MCU7514071.1 acetylornithine transaminase [Ignavibacteria bacterium]MCU7525681.1 acetylornithine transaminase [Ignavibacteria bacterium]
MRTTALRAVAEPGSSSIQPENIAQEIQNKENKPAGTKALMQNYSRYSVEFAKGSGAYLWDTNGKKYLDFLSGIAVTGFGHNHPVIKRAVENQLNNLWHVSNLFEASGQESLASKLAEKSGLSSVFFCNSGTEANEAAIKFARKWGKGRSHIITAVGGFHGRTMGSMSATGQYKVWDGFQPLTPGFSYLPFGDSSVLEDAYDRNLVAVMVEPIQGESGIIVPPKGYLKALREFCDRHDLLLIFDEVQTGMGRTGKFFAHQWEELKPDIITVAKGIANGIPLGAAICSEKVAKEITPGCHGSTFGGNPLAVAAANAVVDMLDSETLLKNERLGNMLMNAIESLNIESIKTIRGKGLLIGLELTEGCSAKQAAKKLLEKGVIVGTSGDTVIRVLPPFVISMEEIVAFTQALNEVLNEN